jgi:hypothetical protein
MTMLSPIPVLDYSERKATSLQKYDIIMKFLMKVSSDDKTVISTVEGKLDRASYLSVRNKIFDLLKSTNVKNVLLDLRRVIMNASTIEVFKMASSTIETFPLGIKYAIVYSEKTTTEENAKFGETVAVNRGGLVKVFRDISEAKKWLAISRAESE